MHGCDLITGGCGFLGANLAAGLLSRGRPVVVLDNMTRVGARENLQWLRERGALDLVEADVRDAKVVEATVGRLRPRAVFHLAGQVAMTTSIQEPRLDFEVNALGTLNVLEAVRRASPESAVLFSSTNKVYGDLDHLAYAEETTRWVLRDHPRGLAEDVPLAFHSPYGCSKGAADQYVLDYARMFGLRTIVFRHSSMYGGRQFATSDQGWIGWFCSRVLAQARGESAPFTISGDGKQVRDVLHASDVVDLYLRSAERIDRVSGQAFNVGGGLENSLSILELLATLGEELGVRPSFTFLPARESDQRVFVADCSRIRGALGWSPRVGWREGLRAMLSWLGARPAEARAPGSARD